MSKLTLLVIAILGMCMTLAHGSAHADTYADCNQTESEPLRIVGCAQVIAAENESPKNIGTAYGKLCTVWASHKDLVLSKLNCEAANALFVQPENYLNLGSAKYENGLLEESLSDFKTAIELSPHFSAAYYNRAVAFERLGDFAKALADYKEAAKYGDAEAAEEVARLAPLTAAVQTKP